MSKERGFQEIGKRLLAVRGAMDQRGFSRRVNVSQQAISNYERGNLPASWRFLRRLHEDFDVSLDWLIVGKGQREFRPGGAYAGLADNRPPSWARAFVEQVALEQSDPLEMVLHLYFLYLATEPADAKARLMGDIRDVIEAVRARREGAGQEPAPPAREHPPVEVLDAIAADDRRAAGAALLRWGEAVESPEQGARMAPARRAYVTALGLARLQRWPELELESARRAGRTCRKEGLWDEAERFYAIAAATFDEGAPEPAGADLETVPPAARARTLLGWGTVAKLQGRTAEAGRRYHAALAWAFQDRDPGLRAEVYLDLACLSYREGELAKATEFLRSGLSFAEQGQDRRLVRQLRLAEALVLREQGELERAEAGLRALWDEAHQEGDLANFALGSLNLAEVLLDAERVAEAEELLQRSSGEISAHRNPRDLALRELLLARIEAAKGERDAAQARLVECLRYARERGLTAEFERAAAALEGARGRSGALSASSAC